MRHHLMRLGSDIQQHVKNSERAIDDGIVAQASLLSALVSARLQLGLAACYQRDLIRETGDALARHLRSREQALEIHDRLADLSRGIGVDPKAFGGSGDKEGNALSDQPNLSLVGTASEAA